MKRKRLLLCLILAAATAIGVGFFSKPIRRYLLRDIPLAVDALAATISCHFHSVPIAERAERYPTSTALFQAMIADGVLEYDSGLLVDAEHTLYDANITARCRLRNMIEPGGNTWLIALRRNGAEDFPCIITAFEGGNWRWKPGRVVWLAFWGGGRREFLTADSNGCIFPEFAHGQNIEQVVPEDLVLLPP